MDAIEYPTLSLGPHELTVRYTQAAMVLMQRRYQMDPRIMPTYLGDNPEAKDNLVKIFSCCVAECFVDRSNPAKCSLEAAPSADYWLTLIEVPEQFQEIDRALSNAIKKAREAANRRAAPALEVVAS